MTLLWSCRCGYGAVHHHWSTKVCPRCGMTRDEAVRAERERLIAANLSEGERARLEGLREKWARGECD